MNVTVLDLPTYRHLPKEFLEFTNSEKEQLIRELCLQNNSISNGSGKKAEMERDKYISDLF